MRFFKFFILAVPAVALSLFIDSAQPARADLMSACEAEIAAHCSDVRRGRGRISACLFANTPRLSAACAPEVEQVSNSRATQRFIPAGVRNLAGSPYEAEVVEACGADARRLCPGVTGKNRNLACLYSRSNQISNGCRTTADRVLRQLR